MENHRKNHKEKHRKTIGNNRRNSRKFMANPKEIHRKNIRNNRKTDEKAWETDEKPLGNHRKAHGQIIKKTIGRPGNKRIPMENQWKSIGKPKQNNRKNIEETMRKNR